MNKQEQILAWSLRPIQVGDYINVNINYTENEEKTSGRGKTKVVDLVPVAKNKQGYGQVKKIINHPEHGTLYATSFSSWSVPVSVRLRIDDNFPYGIEIIKAEWATPDTSKCGADPFKPEPARINFYSKTIDSVLFDCGYDRTGTGQYMDPSYKVINGSAEADKPYIGKTTGGVNFDPSVIDAGGETKYFQRGLVWTTEQNQLLIESIYNFIEIGKFVFRYRSWSQIKNDLRTQDHSFHWDCVDGKQRMNAIIGFVQNKYPDLRGNYWDDLSGEAQRRFLNYDRLAFGKLDEGTTDAAVVEVFLTLNFTGVPMSADHIKFVQSIKM